jgi:oxalate decarboxylase/phosphoglucose isomerase-like protein (cupin superfamily)
MMQIKKIKVSFQDERGKIIDIIQKERLEYVTLISSKKGTIRGNHYHKKSVQYSFLLKGKMKLFTRIPEGKIKTVILKAGDLVYNPAWEQHALVALQDSEFLVFTRGPRGGQDYEKDTFRLKDKLT